MGRPAGSKNKPKEEVKPIGATLPETSKPVEAKPVVVPPAAKTPIYFDNETPCGNCGHKHQIH